MRVYLPATIPLLARLEQERELELPAGYAVTAGLRGWYAEGDEEELEYAALTAAARGSLRLLAARPELPRRRVVLAADVPDARVAVPGGAEAADPGVIKVTGPVRLADIASLHVDEAAAQEAVSAAAKALAAADTGDQDAAFAVDAAEDYDLLWYGTQELGDLV
jgi:hypothetical protein